MRTKKYTARQLEKAVGKYFDSISRTRIVTEDVWTGDTDRYGHPVMIPETVNLDDGSPMTERQWLRPPTVGGLCRALGVHRSTWALWDKDPELAAVVEEARDVMQDYLEQELLTRDGKNVRGVEFALSANYGVSEKKTVEVTGRSMAELSDAELMTIIEEGEGTCTKTM